LTSYEQVIVGATFLARPIQLTYGFGIDLWHLAWMNYCPIASVNQTATSHGGGPRAAGYRRCGVRTVCPSQAAFLAPRIQGSATFGPKQTPRLDAMMREAWNGDRIQQNAV